jgi:hypothetical protein
VGVSQIILSSWGNHEAVTCFGQEILPRVRRLERNLGSEPAAGQARA